MSQENTCGTDMWRALVLFFVLGLSSAAEAASFDETASRNQQELLTQYETELKEQEIASPEELSSAVQSVHQTGSYFSNEVSATFIKGSLQPAEEQAAPTVKLTEREQEVLMLIVQEHTAQEIADKLFVSPSTVITHRKNLLRKLEVKNSAGLVRQAIALGLVQV